MLATLIAVLIHEVREELRKLDPPAGTAAGVYADPHSTTAADTERGAAWDHDTRPPVTAGFGFTRGQRR